MHSAGWRDGSSCWLRTQASLPKEPSSVKRIHAGQSTLSGITALEVTKPSVASCGTWMYAHRPTHIFIIKTGRKRKYVPQDWLFNTKWSGLKDKYIQVTLEGLRRLYFNIYSHRYKHICKHMFIYTYNTYVSICVFIYTIIYGHV